MATGRGQYLPGWLQDFLTSTTRGMETAQCSEEVAREQAAKEAEKHAQLLEEQDKRHKEQMQAILDRLQPAVPPYSGCNTTRTSPWLLVSISCRAIRDPQLSPELNPSQAFLCANFAHGERRLRISSSSRMDPASRKNEKRLFSVLASPRRCVLR